MRKILRSNFIKIGLTTILVLAVVIAVGCGGSNKNARDTDAGKSAGEKVTLTVGYLPITHSLPLFVTDELNKGKFKNVELKLQKFASWPELTEALNSGAIDGAVTMSEMAMVAQAKGIDQQMLALSHRNGDALVAVKSINKVADLKGKTVAIPTRMSGHNILLNIPLKEAGLKNTDVIIREMAPPDMPAALATGEVSAYIVAEPFGTQSILNGKARVLKRASDIWPNWICCALVFNTKVINEKEAAVSELVQRFVDAGKYIDDNQEKAITIAQKYTQIKAENWRESLKLTTYSDLTPTTDEFKKVSDYLKEMKLLQKDADINKLINTKYIKN